MTVGTSEHTQGKFLTVRKEVLEEDGTASIEFLERRGKINPDLTVGADVTSMTPLQANKGMAFQGIIPLGDGFRIYQGDFALLGLDINNLPDVVKPFMIGRDLVQRHQPKWVIDFFGLSVIEAAKKYPTLYQRVLEKVKPNRDQNNRESRKRNWWLFGENAPKLRKAIAGLDRFIVTPDTSKFKPFVFVDAKLLPDVQLYSVVSDDAWILGNLEARVHQIWLEKIAPRMGKGNDIRWKPAIVFDPFPFPDPTPEQKQKIRELGERLDAHRKRVQAQHPDITITGMYNLLEKLRKGEVFTESDRTYNDRALVSTLKQIHDDLDATVLDAYGWQDLKDDNGSMKEGIDEIILERLVALNAERAEEERNGLIRWLRPEYQAPNEVRTQQVLTGVVEAEETVIAPVEQKPFPKQPKEQLAAIRDLLRTSGGEWTIEQIAAQFKNGGRNKAAIAENLERLEWFGMLLVREEGQIKRWQYAADIQQAS